MDDELKRKQLERLRGQASIQAAAEPTAADAVIATLTPDALGDPSLDEEYLRDCANAEYWLWPVLPRLEWEAEHRAWCERIESLRFSQTPDPPDGPFEVGARKSRYGDLVALPEPRPPRHERTQEKIAAYEQEYDLWSEANQALTDCVRYLREKITGPQFWNDIYSRSGNPPPGTSVQRVRTSQEMYDETWSWLMGLWQGKLITPPTEEQMLMWAFPERSSDEEKKSP